MEGAGTFLAAMSNSMADLERQYSGLQTTASGAPIPYQAGDSLILHAQLVMTRLVCPAAFRLEAGRHRLQSLHDQHQTASSAVPAIPSHL